MVSKTKALVAQRDSTELGLPEELDTSADYLTCKGLSLEDSDSYLVDKSGTTMRFKTVADGDVLLTDIKSKGLAQRLTIILGARGTIQNKFLELFDGVPSNESPYVAPIALVLQEVSITTKNNSSAVFEVRKNGSVIETITFSTQKKKYVTGINDSVAANDEISVKVTNTAACVNPIVVLHFHVV